MKGKYSLRYFMFLTFMVMCLSHVLCNGQSIPIKSEKRSAAEERANELTKWMQRNLILSIDQFSQVTQINIACSKKEDSIGYVVKDKHEQSKYIATIRQSRDVEFRSILTEIQYRQYIAHKEKIPMLKRSPFKVNEFQ